MANVFVTVSENNRARYFEANKPENSTMEFQETLSLEEFKKGLGLQKGDFHISLSKDGTTCYWWCRTADGIKMTGVISDAIKNQEGTSLAREYQDSSKLSVSVCVGEEGEFLMLHKTGDDPESQLTL